MMDRSRKILRVSASQPTMEGAGVKLRRAFGFGDTAATDPFLLLDDFRGDDPRDYLKGFPWHPHRGIETITYILEGTVEHGDSMGNSGAIGAGDVQWMTAGSGIIHQEMPKPGPGGRMGGFQLWANLPASQKMMDPRYRGITSADIPVVPGPDGVRTRVICGEVDGTRGPVRDVVIEPEYLDIEIPAGARFEHATVPGHTVFAYVFQGRVRFGSGSGWVEHEHLALLEDGDRLEIGAGDSTSRLLLISGTPLREPVAWHGPIVMNTREELRIAFEEYQNGTFIKKASAGTST
jgi:redox-sensitive bicupin YhaK (pirin superfamily)